VVSGSDIWAVGSPHITIAHQTLTEQWNGSQWSIVPSPALALGLANQFQGVAVVAASNVWTVGFSCNVTVTTCQTLTEHWDGSQWSIVPSP
jgi:hypothetical protein